jgi:hypothetical protein
MLGLPEAEPMPATRGLPLALAALLSTILAAWPRAAEAQHPFPYGDCPAGFLKTAPDTCTQDPPGPPHRGCPLGTTETAPGVCVDVDECATGNGGCATNPMVTCTNTIGSRICGPCPPGYRGFGSGTCTEIIECDVSNGNCDVHATCTNTPAASPAAPAPPA